LPSGGLMGRELRGAEPVQEIARLSEMQWCIFVSGRLERFREQVWNAAPHERGRSRLHFAAMVE
jgi:hypothetical protein